MITKTFLSPSLRLSMLSLLVIAAPSPAGALPAPQTAPQQQPFIDSVRVDVVNIEVVVTDRKGDPVTGLTRDDFQLLVDGTPVEISNFSAIAEHRAVPQEVQPAGEEPEPPSQPLPPPSLPPSQQLSVVVLIDDAGLQHQSRRQAFTALRTFLEPLVESGCRLGLVRFDGSLQIRSELRDDPAAVLDELDRLETAVSGGSSAFLEWSRLLRSLERGRLTQEELMADVTPYIEKLRHECKVKIRVVAAHITALAGLPGRKVVLFVSDGIPARPGESLLSLLSPTQAKMIASRYSLTRELRGLTDLANNAGVTFHTIMGDGWTVAGLIHRLPELSSGAIIRDLSFITDSNYSFSMGMIAERTGGLAVAAKTAALEEIAQDLGSYYSLGFMPDDGGQQRRQRIKVKVPGKNLRVRHRYSYYPLSGDDVMAADAVAALLERSNENPMQISVDIGDLAEKQGRSYLLPVTLHVPNEHLAFLPADGSWRASVVVHLTARGKRGDIVEPVKEILPVIIPNEVYRSGAVQTLVYEVRLRLRAGETRIAVTVHDELGGQESSLSVDIVLGKEGTVSIDPKKE